MPDTAFTIVAPYLDDAEATRCWLGEINLLAGARPKIVLVDDGSVADSANVEWLRDAELPGTVIRLRRNVGHQRAIATGLAYVADTIGASDCVVVMDSDGEDRVNFVPALLESLNASADVAVAVREGRIESQRFQLFYRAYRLVFALLTGRNIEFGNFMALSSAATRRLAAMHETALHVAGAVLVSKMRIARVPIKRGVRHAGDSKMSFVSHVLHGFKAVMVFAEDVLVRVGLLCAFVASVSILGAVAAVALKLLGFATPGWFSVALGILVLMFLQTGALALMMLMLTGVVRLGGTRTTSDYRDLIERIERTETGS